MADWQIAEPEETIRADAVSPRIEAIEHDIRALGERVAWIEHVLRTALGVER